MIDGLLYGYARNLDYLERLCAGLDDATAISQPVSGMNHASWILSHLNIYHSVVAAIIEGGTFPDPKDDDFGMGSAPASPKVPYRPIAELLQQFRSGHERVASLLVGKDHSVFAEPVMLPRWKERMPTAARALPYLMLVHENQHLGQLSAWRRALGLAPA